MNKPAIVSVLATAVIVAGICTANAKPEYAQKENKPCSYCHLSAGGGGSRGFRGQFYGANGLSFEKFDEAREASIAGLEQGTEAGGTRAKVAYAGNVSGPKPAVNQIQALALRRPVLIAFFAGSSTDEKAAAKVLKKLALAYGQKVSIVGVFEGTFDDALKLSVDLGSQIRVFADTNGKAKEKFGATQGLDLVATGKEGDEFKLYSGFSKGTLDTAIAQLGSYGAEAPDGFDSASAPSSPTHSGKLGG